VPPRTLPCVQNDIHIWHWTPPHTLKFI